MSKTASGMDTSPDAGKAPFLTSDVFSGEISNKKCTILSRAVKTDRMQYVMDLLGENIANYDSQVLLKAVDGVYGGLTQNQAGQLHDLAFELANSGAVLARLGKGTTLATLVRQIKK
jgi:hypothetical protein